MKLSGIPGDTKCDATCWIRVSNVAIKGFCAEVVDGIQFERAQSGSRKYQLPDFLIPNLTQAIYERWLTRKAAAHVKRDRKRGNSAAIGEAYRVAIHRAVVRSGGRDHYTNELLDWSLLSQYSNEESKAGGRRYKASLALLPTVDHVGDGLGDADFRICAWRTNDAKNDLTHQEFVALCRRVVAHFDR